MPFLVFLTWKRHLNTLLCLTVCLTQALKAEPGELSLACTITSILLKNLVSPFPHHSLYSTVYSKAQSTFFLIVVDKLLIELEENKAGISICNLYLGVATHAHNGRTIATYTQATEDQSKFYHKK